MTQASRETALRLSIFTILCAAIIAVFSGSSSILFGLNNGDALVFQIVGDGWRDGLIPYRDLFDHKGPLLYLIQIIGNFIWPGKAGVFILEVLFAVATFELIFRCGQILRCPSVLNYAGIATAMILFAAYLEGGNCVEEWSLPFQLLPLYLVLKYLKGRISSITVPALITGICFGAVAMIRINNNCIICGLAVFLIIYWCIHKQYSQITKCIAWFFAGCLLSVAPFIIYFAATGSLNEMVYANFIFNMHYKANWNAPMGLEQYARNTVRLLPCIILPIMSFLYCRKQSKSVFGLMTLISAVTFIVFLTGNGFSHYYLMVIPIAALCVQTSGFSPVTGYLAAAVIALPVIGYYISLPLQRIDNIKKEQARYSSLTNDNFIQSIIPECELDSIYTFGTPEVGGTLILTGHYPIGKYFFMQMTFPKVDDFVKNDIRNDFSTHNPLWVIASHDVPSKHVVPLDSTNYREIPLDSLPDNFPENWHIYKRL